MLTARITAIGTYVPERILSNLELEQMVDTNDEWIVRRTGIRERRIAAEQEFTSDLCEAAAEDLIQRYQVDLCDVDLIIVATNTPDYGFPSTAAQLQHRLRIQGSAAAFDLNAACAGFTYGVSLAARLIEAGAHRKALIIGADTISKCVDYTDRSTCILFGDGAGAVLIEAREAEHPFLTACQYITDGSGGVHVYRTGLSQQMNGTPLQGNGFTVQNGREVYRWAVSTVSSGIQNLLTEAGMNPDEIDWFVPHSANMRMIEAICERSGLPLERTLSSTEWYGNTSAASIPLALAPAVADGRVRPGDRVLMYGFGAGLVGCGLILTM
jgi:3-oxoacyl-[acyl-carrier-protein] synthase-3